eukprot:scaffold940_cov569-Prasinococcus_capsulatus_cf.AAC.19
MSGNSTGMGDRPGSPREALPFFLLALAHVSTPRARSRGTGPSPRPRRGVASCPTQRRAAQPAAGPPHLFLQHVTPRRPRPALALARGARGARGSPDACARARRRAWARGGRPGGWPACRGRGRHTVRRPPPRWRQQPNLCAPPPPPPPRHGC